MTTRFSTPYSPTALGTAACLLIAVGSYGAGATRNRGGIMYALDLDFLTYGHGRGLMDLIFTCGLVLLVIAWLLLWRARPTLATVHNATLRWTIPLLFCAPILSRDVYSYLMQGAMLRDGFDPYSEGAAVNPGPLLWEVSHDWRNTTTPYGPLHLGIGKAVTSITGDNVTAGLIVYKIITVAGFALIIWSVPKIAERIGGNPAFALWLGATNPVMLLHMLGGMHNEAVMVGLVSIGVLSCLNYEMRNRTTLSALGTFSLGIVAIALAVSLKATAAIALPFVVWMLFTQLTAATRNKALRFGVFLCSGAWTLLLTLGVLHLVTYLSGASWGWVAEISGNSKVINPLAAPTLFTEITTPLLQLFDDHFHYNAALATSRTVFSVLMLAGLVIVWWYFRPKAQAANDRRALMGMTAAYGVAFVANAVTLPWYYASLLTLAGTYRPPSWCKQLLIAASVVITLAFTGGGNHRFYDGWFLAAIPAIAFLALVMVDPTKKPWPGRGGSPREHHAHAARQ